MATPLIEHDPLVALLAIYEAELAAYNADTADMTPEQDEASAEGWQRVYSMEVLPSPTTLRGAVVALRAALAEEGDDLCTFTANLVRATLAYLETQLVLDAGKSPRTVRRAGK